MSRPALFAGLALLVLPTTALAGVIVLENGNVIVGRIREAEVNKETITIRWPYKDRTEKGHQQVERYRVRWFHVEADMPTDAYWDQYEDLERYPIERRYHGLRERWKLRKRAQQEDLGDIMVIDPFQGGAGHTNLNPIPVESETFRVHKPEGWTSSIEEGITVFVSNEPGKEGFRPRIHVFSMPSVIEGVEEQILWVQEQLERLADDTGTFEVRQKKRLRPRAGGFDQEMLTKTVRLNRPVMTLRKLSFRKDRTYFFAAYAHEQDYSGLELLFQACMRSLEIFEDAGKEEKDDKGAPAAAAATEAGQPPR